MKALLIILLIALSTTALALQEPDWHTGADCWRYGVEEHPITSPRQVTPPTVHRRLSSKEITTACGKYARGCYKPIEHAVYLRWGSGKITEYHERCHAMMWTATGKQHNACWPHYGNVASVDECEYWSQGDE